MTTPQKQIEKAAPSNHGPIHETDLYDFAGWLTTRPGVMTVGSSCEAGPMAEAVGEYIKTFPERFALTQRPAALTKALATTEPKDDELEFIPTNDFLGGHQCGLEWAACLVEYNDPRTGDWFYDDRNDLANAIRKGPPDMPALKPATTERKGELSKLSDLHIKLLMREAGFAKTRLSAAFRELALLAYREGAASHTSPQVPEDTARLDWMQSQSLDDFAIGFVVDGEKDGEYWCSPDAGGMYYGKTLREAIDAARKAAP